MKNFSNISLISGGVQLNGAVTFGVCAFGLSFISGFLNPISIPILGAFALDLSKQHGKKLNKSDDLILEAGENILSLAAQITIDEYNQAKKMTIELLDVAINFMEDQYKTYKQ